MGVELGQNVVKERLERVQRIQFELSWVRELLVGVLNLRIRLVRDAQLMYSPIGKSGRFTQRLVPPGDSAREEGRLKIVVWLGLGVRLSVSTVGNSATKSGV